MVWVGEGNPCQDELLWVGRASSETWLELEDSGVDGERELLLRRAASGDCGSLSVALSSARYNPSSARFEAMVRPQPVEVQRVEASSRAFEWWEELFVLNGQSVVGQASFSTAALHDQQLSSSLRLEDSHGLLLRPLVLATGIQIALADAADSSRLELTWEGGELGFELELVEGMGVYELAWPAGASCVSLAFSSGTTVAELRVMTPYDGLEPATLRARLLEQALPDVQQALSLGPLFARWPRESSELLMERAQTADEEQLERLLQIAERLPWPQRGHVLMALAKQAELSAPAFQRLLEDLSSFPDARAGALALRMEGLEPESPEYLELALRYAEEQVAQPYRPLLLVLDRRSEDEPALEEALERMAQCSCGFGAELLAWVDAPQLGEAARLALFRALLQVQQGSDCAGWPGAEKVLMLLDEGLLSRRVLGMRLAAKLRPDGAWERILKIWDSATVDIELSEALRALAAWGIDQEKLKRAVQSEWPTLRQTAAELASLEPAGADAGWLFDSFARETWPETRLLLFEATLVRDARRAEALARSILGDVEEQLDLRLAAAQSQRMWSEPLSLEELEALLSAEQSPRSLRRALLRQSSIEEDQLLSWIEAELAGERALPWRRELLDVMIDQAQERGALQLEALLTRIFEQQWEDEAAFLTLLPLLGRLKTTWSESLLQRAEQHPSEAVREQLGAMRVQGLAEEEDEW
jgi:hypothetical protein